MKYEAMKKRAQKHAEKVKEKQEIRKIWHSNDTRKRPLAFSKVAFIFIFLDCLLIQFFSMLFMWTYPEASDIGALIGIAIALLGEVGTCASYYRKSAIENSTNGIVYEATMASIKSSSDMTPEQVDEAVG